jgi:hypothetical protein
MTFKSEGEIPLARPRRRWDDNIKVDVKLIACEGVDWIYLAQVRAQWRASVDTVMNLRFHKRLWVC